MEKPAHRLLAGLSLAALLGLLWLACAWGAQGIAEASARPDCRLPPECCAGVGSPKASVVTLVHEAPRARVTPETLRKDPTNQALSGDELLDPGASAKLSGRITGPLGQAISAELTFVAGMNQGRVLLADGTGGYHASDLYPGLSIVRVTGPGIAESLREVRLRQRRETRFNIDHTRTGGLLGRVRDRAGEPLEGALIQVDGLRVYSGADGGFFVGNLPAGQVLIEVEAPGYAACQGLGLVVANQTAPESQGLFVLDAATSLEVFVESEMRDVGPVRLFLFFAPRTRPAGSEGNTGPRRFPAYGLNPIEVWPGHSVTVPGLPAGRVQIHAFHPGTRAPQKSILLREGRQQRIELRLEQGPQLRGRVLAGGKAVANARVRIAAEDRVRATLRYFRAHQYFLERDVLPFPPAVLEEVRTGPDGRFVLSDWFELSPRRSLIVLEAPPRLGARRLLVGGENTFELELGGFAPEGEQQAVPAWGS